MPPLVEAARRIHERYCMYRYLADAPPALDPPTRPGVSWQAIDAAASARYFGGEPHLQRDFGHFLHQRALGFLVLVDGRWASHLWMSTPGNPRPPHVRADCAPDTYWFFYGATQPEFFGQGLFKLAQRLALHDAFERSHAPQIVADPAWDNTASRRAHLSCGFTPAGMLDCWYFWLPRVARIPLWWHWTRAEHPMLD
jgi:hypothetical protein